MRYSAARPATTVTTVLTGPENRLARIHWEGVRSSEGGSGAGTGASGSARASVAVTSALHEPQAAVGQVGDERDRQREDQVQAHHEQHRLDGRVAVADDGVGDVDRLG